MKNKKIDKKDLLLICLSVLCCVLFVMIFVLSYYDKADIHIQSVRISWINHYISNITNGEFPDFYNAHNNDHAYGIYLVASYLGYILKLGGEEIIVFLSVFLFTLLVITIPFYTFKKTNNVICSCISPFLLCVLFYVYVLTTKCEVYEVLSICVVFWGIPLIEIVSNEKNQKKKKGWYLLLIFLVSITNIARLHVSLGLMLITAFLLVIDIIKSVKNHSILNSFIQIILLFLLFCLDDFFAVSLPEYLIQNDNQPMLNLTNTAWHSVLIGFGTFDNPYNLYYSDTCAWELVHSIDPNIQYASNEYYLKCKELVLEMLRSDFGFCFLSFIKKALRTMRMLIYALIKGKITFVFLAIFSVFYFLNRKIYTIRNFYNDEKNTIFYILVIVLTGSLFSILVTPEIAYSFTSVSALFFCIFNFILIFISKYLDNKK